MWVEGMAKLVLLVWRWKTSCCSSYVWNASVFFVTLNMLSYFLSSSCCHCAWKKSRFIRRPTPYLIFFHFFRSHVCSMFNLPVSHLFHFHPIFLNAVKQNGSIRVNVSEKGRRSSFKLPTCRICFLYEFVNYISVYHE